MARALMAGIAAAVWMVLVDAAFDHEWPSWSLTFWMVYVAGCVVICGGAIVIDPIVAARRRRSTPDGPPPDATPQHE